jgi:hypothetical protein
MFRHDHLRIYSRGDAIARCAASSKLAAENDKRAKGVQRTSLAGLASLSQKFQLLAATEKYMHMGLISEKREIAMQSTLTQHDVELLNAMESKLGRLAARWRGTNNPQEAQTLVNQYQALLRCMVELGYQDALDVDAELPDEYMPAEYLALHD